MWQPGSRAARHFFLPGTLLWTALNISGRNIALLLSCKKSLNWCWKSAWETVWKTDIEKVPGELRRKLMLEKVPGELRGKLMLEKVPDELCGKLILKKCLGNCVENRCWKKWLGKCVVNWCWKKRLENSGKTAEKVTEELLFQGYNVTSLKLKRRQCRLQLGTAMNLVLHICCGLKYDSSSNIHHRQQLIKFLPRPAAGLVLCVQSVAICVLWRMLWNVAIYALWHMLVKCRDLRALTHVGKMSRFTHFARHKILAARHVKLFCTPAYRAQPHSIAFGGVFPNIIEAIFVDEISTKEEFTPQKWSLNTKVYEFLMKRIGSLQEW